MALHCQISLLSPTAHMRVTVGIFYTDTTTKFIVSFLILYYTHVLGAKAARSNRISD